MPSRQPTVTPTVMPPTLATAPRRIEFKASTCPAGKKFELLQSQLLQAWTRVQHGGLMRPVVDVIYLEANDMMHLESHVLTRCFLSCRWPPNNYSREEPDLANLA